MIDKIQVANIPVNLFTVSTLHETVKDVVRNQDRRVFLHANARLLELANTKEKWLVDFFNEPTNYVMCDGSGIQLAAKLTGQPIPEKIPYNTWIWSFAKFLEEEKITLFLLGADKKTIASAKSELERHAKDIRVVGISHGYFSKAKNSPENIKTIDFINSCKPDILLVGFGMPIQERWIKENVEALNVRCIFSCGGAFDFISGNKPVAPKFIRMIHMEWLFRFMLDPVRLFSRVSISFLRFGKVLVKEVMGKNRNNTPLPLE